MIRLITIFILIFLVSLLSAQEKDTTINKQIKLKEVVVTATRTKRKVEDIPAQVDVINSKKIEDFPVSNIDDILRTSANVYVNRSWGIFSKNSSVTMRGLTSSARTLVLIDGVPKNKIAGGLVNWHNINPDNIERIEIIKGPASALYGNNAMGGVINIITKKPEKRIEGSLKSFYGTYNTLGSSLNISGKEINNDKGFYWDLNAYYRQGDGYIFEPPEFIDETDAETYLKEYGGGTKLGYMFNKSNSIEIIYDYFDEKRGAGRQVFVNDGSYESYITNQVKSKYTGKIGKADIKAILYFTEENFYGQKESLNDYNEYKLLDSYTDKTDKGFWTTYSNKLLKKNYITIGVEIKMGDVDGEEIYRTSPDIINFRSKMDILGFFIQDEINFLNNRFKLIAGLRNDIVRFYDGYQSVTEPTKVTGFSKSFSENFKNNHWNAISPKIALQYSINRKSKIYASVGTGFKPPKLKDLSQTGKIRKGFRLANPDLRPETLTNYELGYSHNFSEKIKINTAVYYSLGKDFQYMIGTGDSIDTGGSSLKPVLQSDNVARIGVAGGELSLSYFVSKNISFNANYSYNYSKVIEYESSEINPDKDLTGRYMVEVSPHLFYAGINYKNKYFAANFNCNYVDEQWYDDENTILTDDYFVANLKLSKTIKKHYKIYLDFQNIFDNEFVDRKGKLSPGRYIIGGFQYII